MKLLLHYHSEIKHLFRLIHLNPD